MIVVKGDKPIYGTTKREDDLRHLGIAKILLKS